VAQIGQPVRRHTAGGAGSAYYGTGYATAAQQSAQQPGTRYQARTATNDVARTRITS
jgi:hypothetical protein